MKPQTRIEPMRQVLIFMCLVAAAAIGATRYMDHAAKNGSSNAMAVATKPAAAAPPAVQSGGYRTVTLTDNGRGSFEVEARVEGRSLDFVVDTGASSVALRETAAAKLGIHPAARDYTIRTQTANGVGKAAPVMLDRVEINGITVRGVRAIVVPDEALSTNLLGMTFLSRVKWTHDRGRLVLEQ
jgi:aspartyl protease family protein